MRPVSAAILFLVAFVLLAGCRTAGPQVCIRDSHHVNLTMPSETRASMGKSVSGELSPEVSAGVTAQANGNAVSQSGAATASPSGTYDASADASAGDPAQAVPDAAKAVAEADAAVLSTESAEPNPPETDDAAAQ